MAIKLTPRYEQVSLDDLGYKAGWIEIRINPTGAEARAFADAWSALIQEDSDWQLKTAERLRALSALAEDDVAGRQQLAALHEKAERERTGKRKGLDRAFLDALTPLLGRCQIDGAEYPLNTVEGLEAFESEGDPQVIWFGRGIFLAHREERITGAVDNFRRRRGAGTEPTGGKPGAAPVAIADSGRANGTSTESVPGQ